MKSRICRWLLIFVLSSLCACAPVTMQKLIDAGKAQLTKLELQELLTDNTLHLESIDMDARVHFLPDGRLNATSLQGEKDSGKWSLSAGDELCMKFVHWYYGDLKCYKIFKEKNSYVFFTSNGARSYTATRKPDSKAEATGQSLSDESNTQALDQEDSPAAPMSKEEQEHTLISLARNCPDCDLAGVTLAGAQLVAANLAGANLSGADLHAANLRRANLAGANLSGANLTGTNLAGADLTGADLSNADLTGSNLIRANVTGAKLNGAVLSGAHLGSIQGYKE
ncbi:pentapeptide repeat-containing protein [Desulfopila sp. IMCC35006]|uniref:pentapeptide repeat-containing protein n=1 Tax=Desulfopila sp. IMCC35006 TaxID=2569542 RepID=UPI00197AD503|nr:pentapeptide repeat-containing protein [Desulfopila sp. IMCC35006]